MGGLSVKKKEEMSLRKHIHTKKLSDMPAQRFKKLFASSLHTLMYVFDSHLQRYKNLQDDQFLQDFLEPNPRKI